MEVKRESEAWKIIDRERRRERVINENIGMERVREERGGRGGDGRKHNQEENKGG